MLSEPPLHRRALMLLQGRLADLRAWQARRAAPMEFAEPLESQFRSWHNTYVRTRVRRNIWLPFGALLLACFAPGPFAELRALIFDHHPAWLLEALRFGLLGPSSIAVLMTAYLPTFAPYYARTAQVVAPLHACCFVVIDALMRPVGLSLGTWMVLVVVGPYFLFGLLHTSAVRTAFVVLSTYALFGVAGGMDAPQWRFDLAVLAFAGYLGASIHYSMQRGLRKNFLQNKALAESAHRDGLTGIYNRRMFDDHLERLWQQASRSRVPLALLLIDIDHFKLFNDSRGHQAGDESLQRIARVIADAARRPLDLAARYGGEEFTLVLYDVRRDKVEQICFQLQAAIAELQIQHPGSTISAYVTASIGVACIEPASDRSPRGFIQLADEALYAAKEGGRNQVVVMDREYETLTTGAFRFHGRRRSA